MQKINELTLEQEAKFDFYVEKWLKIGLSTTPTNDSKVADLVADYYRAAELDPPKEIFIVDSPYQALMKANQIEGNKELKWLSYVGGNFWAGWQARFDFYLSEGIVTDIEEIRPTLKLSEEVGWIYPYDNVCIVTRKPKVIHFMNDNLHCPTGPAIEWHDGFCLYSLNDIRMDGLEWFFDQTMDKKEKAKRIMSIENVEQRSEAIRTFGMSNIFEILDKKVINKRKDGYEVWTINVGTDRKEEYLKMINPSTGEIHVECVEKGIKTVESALKSRIPERQRTLYGYKEAIART